MRRLVREIGVGLLLLGTPAQTEPQRTPAQFKTDLTIFEGETELFLAVIINGKNLATVSRFTAHPATNQLSARRADLKEIGIRPGVGGLQRVYLDDIPGLDYSYDDVSQTLLISAANTALLPNVISATSRPEYIPPERSTGMVFNYALTAAYQHGANGISDHTLAGAFDAWVYSPIGRFGSTGIYRYSETNAAKGNFTRLESSYELNDNQRALTLRVGDFTSSSLSWSRPIRMAGVQFQRDFGLRSDLVTDQLLTFSGAAAVPSTVDVFIDNSKAYGGPVAAGPFRIEDIPLYSGSGDAVIVVTDAEGNTKTRQVSFFSSRNLLKKGLFDFSFEAGRARQAYGLESGNYGEATNYSGSLRYGLTESLTASAHAEGNDRLSLIGFGIDTVPFSVAELSLSAAASRHDGHQSHLFRAAIRTHVKGVDINISSQRSQDGFVDLAYLTGLDYLGSTGTSGTHLEYPRALDIVSLAIPLGGARNKLGLSMVHSERANSRDKIVTASYGQTFGSSRSTLSLNGAHNFETDQTRVSFSLSMPLGDKRYVRSSIGRETDDRFSSQISLDRPIGQEVGDYGYSLALRQVGDNALAGARGSYRSRAGKGSLELRRRESGKLLLGQFEGAIVLTRAGLSVGNTVRDSFAIVDVGVPNVPVELQNRVVTTTNASGRAMISGLASNRNNRVSVNVENLPEDTSIMASAATVTPARQGGAVVELSGMTGPAALVVLRTPDGSFLPPGTKLRLNGRREDVVVGYDGLAWLENLKPQNLVLANTGTGRCSATFDYVDTGATQDMIDPVVCQ